MPPAQRTIVSCEQLAACGIGSEAITHRVRPAARTSCSSACTRSAAENSRRSRESRRPCSRAAAARSSATSRPRSSGAAQDRAGARRGHGRRRGAARRATGLRVHRIRAIDRREVRHHEGLWVSSPARAVLEVAAVAPEELARRDRRGLASRVLDRRELERVLARNRPCRGAARLAAIVGDPDAMTLTRSKRERAFLRLIRQSGLPMPETNVKFGPLRGGLPVAPGTARGRDRRLQLPHRAQPSSVATARRTSSSRRRASRCCGSPGITSCTSRRWCWSGSRRRSLAGASD